MPTPSHASCAGTLCSNQHLLSVLYQSQLGCYLLVCQGVHVANNLGCHLPSVCGTVLEGSLDDGHDEGEGRGINKVDKLGVQQGLQALLGLPGGVRQGIQQDRSNGCMSKQRETGLRVYGNGKAARSPDIEGSEEKGVRATAPWSPSPQVTSSGSQPVCKEQSLLQQEELVWK